MKITFFSLLTNICWALTVYKDCTRNYGEMKVKDTEIYIVSALTKLANEMGDRMFQK